jgi:hypothetical protein
MTTEDVRNSVMNEITRPVANVTGSTFSKYISSLPRLQASSYVRDPVEDVLDSMHRAIRRSVEIHAMRSSIENVP